MSADTGALEPQDLVARSAKIAETREVLRNALASTQVGNAGWNEARDALDTLCESLGHVEIGGAA